MEIKGNIVKEVGKGVDKITGKEFNYTKYFLEVKDNYLGKVRLDITAKKEIEKALLDIYSKQS